MTNPTDHQPEPWYWEAGSEHCPHGPESDRHTASPQDVVICLDAPMGDHCPECSADHGDAVPWADCPERAAVSSV